MLANDAIACRTGGIIASYSLNLELIIPPILCYPLYLQGEVAGRRAGRRT